MRVRIISHLSLLVVEVLPWTTMCGGAEARCVLCSINVAAPEPLDEAPKGILPSMHFFIATILQD